MMCCMWYAIPKFKESTKFVNTVILLNIPFCKMSLLNLSSVLCCELKLLQRVQHTFHVGPATLYFNKKVQSR